MNPNPSELLPCPFCGGKPQLNSARYDSRFARCVGCGISWLTFRQWNTRHSPTQPLPDDLSKAVEHAKKAIHCLYIAVDQSVAKQIEDAMQPVFTAAKHSQDLAQRVRELENRVFKLSSGLAKLDPCNKALHEH